MEAGMAAMRVQDLATEIDRDRWVYRVVVVSLGLAILIAAVGAVVLQYNGHDSPAILVAIGSGAIGALAGLLAPAPGTSSGG